MCILINSCLLCWNRWNFSISINIIRPLLTVINKMLNWCDFRLGMGILWCDRFHDHIVNLWGNISCKLGIKYTMALCILNYTCDYLNCFNNCPIRRWTENNLLLIFFLFITCLDSSTINGLKMVGSCNTGDICDRLKVR